MNVIKILKVAKEVCISQTTYIILQTYFLKSCIWWGRYDKFCKWCKLQLHQKWKWMVEIYSND